MMKWTPLCFALVLIGCSDHEREAELEGQIADLEEQLDDCFNGAEKLLARMQLAFDSEQNKAVKDMWMEFEFRHPETAEFETAKAMYQAVIDQEEADRIAEEKAKEAEKKKRLRALKKLKKDQDDVSGVTWYKQPYFTHYNNTNRTSIYMGDNGTKPWLRLKMSYRGDNWIFFERAYLSYDGNTREIAFSRYDNKESDNSGGKVWEWIDVQVDSSLESFLREFAQSSKAKMRLTGKYTETRTLSSKERKGILDVLSGYDALRMD